MIARLGGLALAGLVMLGAGCKKKSGAVERDPVAERVASPTASPAIVVPPGPLGTDTLIGLAIEGLQAPYEIAAIRAHYVRADGIVDRTYGKVAFEYVKHLVSPGDDPKRPIGAPVLETAPVEGPRDCPRVVWETGSLLQEMTGVCPDGVGLTARPKCSIVQVWRRAIDDGAPANALAKLELDDDLSAQSAGNPAAKQWVVSIVDEPRKIDFSRTYRDDCDGMSTTPSLPAEAGPVADLVLDDPTHDAARASQPACDEVSCVLEDYTAACCQKFKKSASKDAKDANHDALPEAPGREAIVQGVGVVKPAIARCAETSPGTGTVKVRFEILPTGKVGKVDVKESPNVALGSCVAAVVRKATFAASRNGVSVAFPFTFR